MGPEHPGAAAGENFQLAYRSNFLIPHRRAAWIRFWERLDEAADFAVGIRGLPHGREVLHGVAASLRSVSQELAEHTADE